MVSKIKKIRSNESLKLLSWGFRNTNTYLISESNKTFFDVKTWLGKDDTIKAVTKEDIYITLSKKDSNKLKVILSYTGPVKAPVKKDEEVAAIKILKKMN